MSFIQALIFSGKNQKIKNTQFVFQTFQNQCDYFLFFGHTLVAHRRLTKKFKKKPYLHLSKNGLQFLSSWQEFGKLLIFQKKCDKIVTKCDTYFSVVTTHFEKKCVFVNVYKHFLNFCDISHRKRRFFFVTLAGIQVNLQTITPCLAGGIHKFT